MTLHSFRKAIVLLALLVLGSAVHGTSLKDFWSSRPIGDPHFESAKSRLALEECIALELSEKVGIPNIIHGDRETIITGMTPGLSVQPIGGARILDQGASREIFVGALQAGGWKGKVSVVVEGCL